MSGRAIPETIHNDCILMWDMIGYWYGLKSGTLKPSNTNIQKFTLNLTLSMCHLIALHYYSWLGKRNFNSKGISI